MACAFWLAAALFLAANTSDPIDQAVKRADGNPVWGNGLHHFYNLPVDASNEQLVAAVFRDISILGTGESYEILDQRSVKVGGSSYRAVLILSGSIEAVLFLHFCGNYWTVDPMNLK